MASLTTAVLPLYELAMRLALPFLKRNQRLKQGWDQRVFRYGLPTPADLWIQAASVGEAFLAWEIVNRLESPFAPRPLRVLLTTNTTEGLSILSRIVEANADRTDLALQTAYFPLDLPSIMTRALARIQPRTAVLLEGEVWPGFLAACRTQSTEVLLINGRMSTASLAGYLAWPRFFSDLGPAKVLAMSETDALRFSAIYGSDRVEAMSNIKFDRLTAAVPEKKDNPLLPLIGETTAFAVFGSIRKEEEAQVLELVDHFRSKRPKAIIGLFPRHLQRVEPWAALLTERGLPFALRSEIEGTATPGTIILWDTIGEMGAAFGLARAAFIGGTLAPVGGQNFLEPLAVGVVPVIGPHWANFAWVGREVVDSGLVRERHTWREVLDELLRLMAHPPARSQIIKEFETYVAERTGGSQTACTHIAQSLTRV